jgi:hypothetical protein
VFFRVLYGFSFAVSRKEIAMPLTPGQILQNRYRIISLLGQGGMGAVYRAWDTRLSVPVAIKEMVPQPGLDSQTLAQLRQQFQREAMVLARLIHPNLVRVTDFFEEGGNAYLVMDFVEGQSLADLIAARGPLPEAQVLDWARNCWTPWPTATARGSSTGTSNPRTSSSAPMDVRFWWTSGW